MPKINSLRNSQIWEDLYYVHDTTIDNTIETNDNTLVILGKDVLQSLGSVHDTNILGKDVSQPLYGNAPLNVLEKNIIDNVQLVHLMQMEISIQILLNHSMLLMEKLKYHAQNAPSQRQH